MRGEGVPATAVATNGDNSVATNGDDALATTVAISGYDSTTSATPTDAANPHFVATALPDNVKLFPKIVVGDLFGLAKNTIIWRKPKRKTKPGNPKVAADSYEWRRAPTGDGFVLWLRPYLSDGKRGESSYVAHYALETVKSLEKQYGSRTIAKRTARPGGVDRRRGANSNAGQQDAGFG